jgi:cytochrome P450
LRAFVDHPEQWEAMAADPSLVPGAVEEVLRWVTPLNNMFRRAGADTSVGGQAIRRGDRLILLYPSANRDEAVFVEPFTFDIRRSPNPQIAFGFGTHLCVGTHVARTTLAAVFGQLARRITDLRVVTEPDVEPNVFARAVRSFRLGYRVR